jgi:hypothetical protein
MFLLSLTATCQVWTVSLKAGLFTYKWHAGDGVQLTLSFSFPPRLMPSVRWRESAGGGSTVDQYEQAVLDYICGRADRFLNWQFAIPYDGEGGGSCPDFLVLDFRETTAYVVEVTGTADCRGLIGRVRERETRWLSAIKKQLRGLNPSLVGWDLHVTLFVRDEQVVNAERAVQQFQDVSVIPLSKALFSWNWDWQANGSPINTLRHAAKTGRVHAI